MKEALLTILICGIVFSSFSQKSERLLRSTRNKNFSKVLELPPQRIPTVMTKKATIKTEMLNGMSLTYIPMGQAGNAYGYAGNSKTYLWADPNLNSVVFSHRMTGGLEIEGNSRMAYDVSTDQGASFVSNTQVYTPLATGATYPLAAARNPQGAIINPPGNTDPNNAFYTYLCAALDQSNNGDWGGYGYGSNPLIATNPATPTQVNLTSDVGYKRLNLDAMTVTQQGVSWYVAPSAIPINDTIVNYQGNLILGRGELVDGAILYQERLLPFLNSLDIFNDTKIAFATDGQTGFILAMVDLGFNQIPYTNFHPVLLKTVDGGQTWSDPIHVQLGGEDGLGFVRHFFADTAILNIAAYSGGFVRDEVYYNMGYSADMVVDKHGNPHIIGLIAVADPNGWYPYDGTMATWHVYSLDGGTTWDAMPLYNNNFFEGVIGDIVQDNRPYIASTGDGEFLFFSWNDSNFNGSTENLQPDIYFCAYEVESQLYMEIIRNVTAFSNYWYKGFFQSMSHYVFGNDLFVGGYAIPFVFTEFTVTGSAVDEMNFYYIKGVEIHGIGVEENQPSQDGFTLSQNSPNPAVFKTRIMVTTQEPGTINLMISTLTGQVVYQESVFNKALLRVFNIDVSKFVPGIYFYSVEIDNKSITKKMIVK
ncbi:MAG: T9SS type A sorting domain-containing protein [Bacteroidales bacterium]|nr:T9SS type A sorting domain-containing protein [Bacteroidales bacterium]